MFERFDGIERLFTLFTLIGFLSSVSSFMFSNRLTISKGFPTFLTFYRIFLYHVTFMFLERLEITRGFPIYIYKAFFHIPDTPDGLGAV